jgi:hypothetical protein
MAIDLIATLSTARDNFALKLLDISTNPKPNYSIEGQSVSHAEFLKVITDGLKAVQELLNTFDPYYKESVVV